MVVRSVVGEIERERGCPRYVSGGGSRETDCGSRTSEIAVCLRTPREVQGPVAAAVVEKKRVMRKRKGKLERECVRK